MALVRQKQVWALSLICTVASSLGAVVGYVIGYGLWNPFGVRLVELYGYGEGFTAYQDLIEQWGVWIIIAKSLTPIPFKIMAIAAGVAAVAARNLAVKRNGFDHEIHRNSFRPT